MHDPVPSDVLAWLSANGIYDRIHGGMRVSKDTINYIVEFALSNGIVSRIPVSAPHKIQPNRAVFVWLFARGYAICWHPVVHRHVSGHSASVTFRCATCATACVLDAFEAVFGSYLPNVIFVQSHPTLPSGPEWLTRMEAEMEMER